jgi:hypothetical protein
MKGIVADFVAGAHAVNFLACRLYSSPMKIAVHGSSGLSSFRIAVRGSQMRDEFLADGFGDRRSIVLEFRKPRT